LRRRTHGPAVGVKARRVCVLTETFYPDVVDGLTLNAYRLAERLIARGQDLFVVTRYMRPGTPAGEIVGTVPIIRIPPRGPLKGIGWRAIGPITYFLARLSYWLIRHADDYDIVMTHGTNVLPIPLAPLRLIGLRKTWVVRAESPMEVWQEISPASAQRMGLSRASPVLRAWRRLRRAVLRRADCVVAISSEIREAFLSVGIDPEKIRCIPNGIDTVKFAPAPPEQKPLSRRELGLPVDKVLVTYTGRLAAAKGLLPLIRVWRELVSRHPSAHLVLVGSGGEHTVDNCESELRQFIATHGLEPAVSLPGQVDNVAEYLRASDLFVLPSEYEGLSLSLLEALACGLPAVATRVGAAPEVLEHERSGILIEPKDPPALERGIEWLLNHRERWPAMAAAARQTVLQNYSLDAVCNAYVRLFQDLRPGDSG